jgi:hypothetical protein
LLAVKLVIQTAPGVGVESLAETYNGLGVKRYL